MKRKLSSPGSRSLVVGRACSSSRSRLVRAREPQARRGGRSCKEQIADDPSRSRRTQRAASLTRQADTQPIAVAELFRLAKAMPDRADMPGILLELTRIAEETGIEFESITPGGRRPPAGLPADPDHARLRRQLLQALRLPLPPPQPRRRAHERAERDRAALQRPVDHVRSRPSRLPGALPANVTVNAFVYGTGAPAAARRAADGAGRDARRRSPRPRAATEAAAAEGTP